MPAHALHPLPITGCPAWDGLRAKVSPSGVKRRYRLWCRYCGKSNTFHSCPCLQLGHSPGANALSTCRQRKSTQSHFLVRIIPVPVSGSFLYPLALAVPAVIFPCNLLKWETVFVWAISNSTAPEGIMYRGSSNMFGFLNSASYLQTSLPSAKTDHIRNFPYHISSCIRLPHHEIQKAIPSILTGLHRLRPLSLVRQH